MCYFDSVILILFCSTFEFCFQVLTFIGSCKNLVCYYSTLWMFGAMRTHQRSGEFSSRRTFKAPKNCNSSWVTSNFSALWVVWSFSALWESIIFLGAMSSHHMNCAIFCILLNSQPWFWGRVCLHVFKVCIFSESNTVNLTQIPLSPKINLLDLFCSFATASTGEIICWGHNGKTSGTRNNERCNG